MIDEILTQAGFVRDVTYTQAVFLYPPPQPFVVYFDDIDVDGSDFTDDISEHAVRFELYAPDRAAPEAEQRIGAALRAHGVRYTVRSRVWIEAERYFLTVYEFDFTEKE